ncbi:MAG: flagellar basal body P-ring formation protein FlgA, partial [Planctomycetes bacterium]|nr:flagellar basal body P-ring formation protein FlgA [Planctomycetota bacterium]
MRKDCDNHQSSFAARVACLVWLANTFFAAQFSFAEPREAKRTIRLWPTAVVASDPIRLGELCELSGFNAADERTLSQISVAEAPVSGGTRVVHLDLVRSVMSSAGMNMASIVIAGATQCEVSRPLSASSPSSDTAGLNSPGDQRSGRSSTDVGNSATVLRHAKTPPGATDLAKLSLRDAISRFFDAELTRFQATAEVTFDRTPSGVLDLCGPTFEFHIKRKSATPLGLVSIEAEVSTGGRVVQVVPMQIQVAMIRKVATARRAINQGAMIASADVELSTLTFHRTDDIGVDDLSELVGQRAKQMMTAGAVIEADMVEIAPVVTRGQLITLASESGGVRVVTAAKST